MYLALYRRKIQRCILSEGASFLKIEIFMKEALFYFGGGKK
jgi:hypothetical protein